MPIYRGDTEIDTLYAGDTELSEVYAGDVLIWSALPIILYDDSPKAVNADDWVPLVNVLPIYTTPEGLGFETSTGGAGMSAVLTNSNTSSPFPVEAGAGYRFEFMFGTIALVGVTQVAYQVLNGVGDPLLGGSGAANELNPQSIEVVATDTVLEFNLVVAANQPLSVGYNLVRVTISKISNP
jgi:hypothetical protein